MADPSLPTAHVELYLDIWERVGTDAWTVDRLRRADTTASETDADGDGPDVETALETLLAAGLVGRLDEERYRIRLSPDETLDDWVDQTVARVSSLHERVQSVRRDRERGAAPASLLDETVTFEGGTYLPVSVSTDATSAEVTRAVRSTLADQSDHDGVVLTSPAEAAAHVQRVADRLCNPDDGPPPSDDFEKVTSEVRGTNPDQLTYRLYLTACEQSVRTHD